MNEITEQKLVAATACQKVNSYKIISMGFKRDNDGLRIFIQSPIDWKILKRNNKFVLGGVPCFTPRQEKLQGLDSRFSQNNSHENDGMPNLTMLLAENIKDGVNFVFPPFPISEEQIQAWLNQFKQDVKMLFLTYVKPIDYSVVITSQTVERDIHD